MRAMPRRGLGQPSSDASKVPRFKALDAGDAAHGELSGIKPTARFDVSKPLMRAMPPHGLMPVHVSNRVIVSFKALDAGDAAADPLGGWLVSLGSLSFQSP